MKAVSAYFDDESYEILAELAEENQRSKSQMMLFIFKQYLAFQKETKRKKNKEPIENMINKHTNEAIARYADVFKEKHGVGFKCSAKDTGCLKRLVRDVGIGDLIDYIYAYFELPDATLEQKRHPVALLEARLNEVRVYAETGQYMTQQQAYNINKQIKASKKKEKKPEDESFPF